MATTEGSASCQEARRIAAASKMPLAKLKTRIRATSIPGEHGETRGEHGAVAIGGNAGQVEFCFPAANGRLAKILLFLP